MIHRAIKAAINKDTYKTKDWNFLGEHCSMTERRADEASRDVTNWLKCFYMQDKVGEVYEGTVAGVTSFGVFVALDEVYVEGLLHVTELGNDYFHYEKAKHEMVGERTGAKYRLGDRVTIKVARVDMETSRMDFSLVNKDKSSKIKTSNVKQKITNTRKIDLKVTPKKKQKHKSQQLKTKASKRKNKK